MSSERDNRQRAAARARLEREMAARQEAARRRRTLQTRILTAAAALVVLGAATWIIIAAASGGSDEANGTTTCNWTSALPEQSPADSTTPTSPATSASASTSPGASPTPTSTLPANMKDEGLPPTTVPNVGYQLLTFDTNLGQIKVEMDLAKTPCTAASLAHLASKGYYDNSNCHRLVPSIFALQCGDPTGTGFGGATYTVIDENLQKTKLPAYHAGDVAMANVGQPDSNGTQFFFVYDTSQLQGDYSLWGKVVEGLDIVKKIGAAGDDGAYEAEAGGGHPKLPVTFTKVTAGPVTASPTPVPPTTPPATTPAASPTSASPKAS